MSSAPISHALREAAPTLAGWLRDTTQAGLRSSADRSAPWRGLGAGLAGGFAGVVAMTILQTGLGRAQRALARARGGEAASGGQDDAESATALAAERMSRPIVRRPLNRRERRIGGSLVHLGFGTAMGGLYGLAAEEVPATTAGRGAAFGAALMVAADEILVPALHLAPGPRRTPLRRHASALAAHLVYGLVVDAVRVRVRARI
ncbi:MAG TPA: DUF1440 domain-containing protein [Myxococcota bacterium]|jgi:hypothetical protein|nr:DUF1440 domain-containing protein [Myxococcota bacterium]